MNFQKDLFGSDPKTLIPSNPDADGSDFKYMAWTGPVTVIALNRDTAYIQSVAAKHTLAALGGNPATISIHTPDQAGPALPQNIFSDMYDPAVVEIIQKINPALAQTLKDALAIWDKGILQKILLEVDAELSTKPEVIEKWVLLGIVLLRAKKLLESHPQGVLRITDPAIAPGAWTGVLFFSSVTEVEEFLKKPNTLTHLPNLDIHFCLTSNILLEPKYEFISSPSITGYISTNGNVDIFSANAQYLANGNAFIAWTNNLPTEISPYLENLIREKLVPIFELCAKKWVRGLLGFDLGITADQRIIVIECNHRETGNTIPFTIMHQATDFNYVNEQRLHWIHVINVPYVDWMLENSLSFLQEKWLLYEKNGALHNLDWIKAVLDYHKQQGICDICFFYDTNSINHNLALAQVNAILEELWHDQRLGKAS